LNVAFQQLYGASLAASGQQGEAARQFREANARRPLAATWQHWMRAAVFEGVGKPSEVMAAAPSVVNDDIKSCWQHIVDAAASTKTKERLASAGQASRCLTDGAIESQFAITTLAALGDVDAAFRLAEKIDRANPILSLRQTAWLLAPTGAAMRADKRFLPLMDRLGVYQYWLDTKTHPDFCDAPAEKKFEVCLALRAAQAGK